MAAKTAVHLTAPACLVIQITAARTSTFPVMRASYGRAARVIVFIIRLAARRCSSEAHSASGLLSHKHFQLPIGMRESLTSVLIEVPRAIKVGGREVGRSGTSRKESYLGINFLRKTVKFLRLYVCVCVCVCTLVEIGVN